MANLNKSQAPLLALRDTVLFPNIVATLHVGREKSIKALDAAEVIDGNAYCIFSAQKDSGIEDPAAADIYEVGVLAKIIQTVKLPNNNVKIWVEVQHRVKLKIAEHVDEFLVADYEVLDDRIVTNDKVLQNSTKHLVELFSKYISRLLISLCRG